MLLAPHYLYLALSYFMKGLWCDKNITPKWDFSMCISVGTCSLRNTSPVTVRRRAALLPYRPNTTTICYTTLQNTSSTSANQVKPLVEDGATPFQNFAWCCATMRQWGYNYSPALRDRQKIPPFFASILCHALHSNVTTATDWSAYHQNGGYQQHRSFGKSLSGSIPALQKPTRRWKAEGRALWTHQRTKHYRGSVICSRES